MKLSSVVRLRIPILLALVVGEVIGLHHFYRQQSAVNFIFLSLSGILLINSLFSTNWAWVRERKFRYAGIVIPMGQVLVAFRYWNAGDHISSVSLATLQVVYAIGLHRKLFKKVDPMKRIPGGDNQGHLDPRDLLRGMYVSSSIAIFVCAFVAVRSWLYCSSVFWADFMSILVLVHLLAVAFTAYLYKNRRRLSGKASASRESVIEEGGRA